MTDAGGPVILALETSCDETAVAVLRAPGQLLAAEVASQIELHNRFGGVVPEVASRNHLLALRPLIERALGNAGVAGVGLAEVDALAATAGPGLATSLMIGLSAAKGLAVRLGKPFFAVNHLEGHLLSPFFGGVVEPCVALVASGGHTMLVEVMDAGKYRLLGQTRDDAAGEAFDKVAKLLGLPYPGGPEIERRARSGDGARFALPRSMMDSGNFAFSFSGLKTAVRYLLPKVDLEDPQTVDDLCASFQEAVVDVLVAKTIVAAQKCGRKLVTASGGVSCNSRLRERMGEACEVSEMELRLTEPRLCTDNAAMIAFVAAGRLERGEASPLTAEISPNLVLVEV
ncbi:MAG: tRNA (adenosine(37)-N6)-threonylcarbamoyltransferase complex transferase subunit TsaD [Chthoniobacteraceae bacterium]|jgi:N6-L-threonylcarbamoyladenine synthase